ncbi:MAG: SOS response-associated peptidase [Pseudomonadota bacterium]
MCGRFALTVPHEAVADIFDAAPDPALVARGPRYNICPTQEVEVCHLGDEGRQMTRMRWGFLPQWYDKPSAGPLIINARSETIAEKPAFRKSVRERRCLIPASGFYEWRQSAGKGKEPYWISAASGAEVLAWAGVWRTWEGDGLRTDSCAIVTTAANGPLAPIHHRAPLAIAPEDFGLWLGEEGKGAARLMAPATDDFFAFHQVDPAVNKAKADGPQLMAPLSEGRLL